MIGPEPLPLGRFVYTGEWIIYGIDGQQLAHLNSVAAIFGNTTNNPAVTFAGTGPATFGGNLALAGNLAVTGNATITGNLSVSGSVTLNSAIPISQGGTAGTTAAAARANLGLGTLATLNTAAAGNVSGGVLRQASLGSGVVTVQSGGSPPAGSDGDICLIY